MNGRMLPLNYPKAITLRIEDWKSMLADVKKCVPEEACGLLVGVGGKSYRILSVKNVEKSPIRFRMDPHQQVEALLDIEGPRRGVGRHLPLPSAGTKWTVRGGYQTGSLCRSSLSDLVSVGGWMAVQSLRHVARWATGDTHLFR